MRRGPINPFARRPARVLAAAITLAMLSISGVLIGPAPQPAAAALVATGVPDSLSTKHDRTAVVPAPGVLGNDLNLIGGSTAILVSGVAHGTLSLQADGGYTYTPAAGYVGSDSFKYHPSGLLFTTATVTITITNATPVVRPDAYSSPAGTTLVVPAPGVLGNDTDADGDALVTQRVGGITGSLDLDPDGRFTYTPGGGFSGTATFSYRVWDGVAWSSTTTVSLTIVAPTPSPTPTPAPTSAPTSTPAPTPTPTPGLPLPIPSLPLPSLPLPSLPLPTPTPAPALPSIGLPTSPTTGTDDPAGSATPRPSATQSVAGQPDGGADPGSGPTPPRSGAGDPSVSAEDRTGGARSGVLSDAPALDLGLGALGVLAGVEIWAVPAAVLGGPGLLVLVWMALQAAGALAWIPAARRLRDGDVTRARRRR
jgi:hypothetical protein